MLVMLYPLQALSIKVGDTVPEWLRQRYKSKWKKTMQTKEQKEDQQEAQKKEREDKKRKLFDDAKSELLEVVQLCPPQDSNLQDRREWDLKMHEKLQALLSSPRAKKKNRQYVETRRSSSALDANKKDMIQQLTTLKDEGGELKGGANKDTYNHKMKQEVKKRLEKKEAKAKAEEAKKTKKKFASLKMIATKLKNKKAKEEAAKVEMSKEAAVAVVSVASSSTD